MKTILFSAPYMIPFVERFRPVFARYGIELILPEVHERLEEADILKYAGQFDGAICGDDRYTERALEACAPRLKSSPNGAPAWIRSTHRPVPV